jgi:hypothetical protein
MLKWLTEKEGWKVICSFTYLFICLFDFVIVPSWIGITRRNFEEFGLTYEELNNLSSLLQAEIIEYLTSHHDPLTLKGGGLFHLSFGVILTGAVFKKNQ